MEFRLANETHAEGIAALISLTWGNAADAQWISTILRHNTNIVWIALDYDDMVGFCAGFVTTDRFGTLRWEIDLLAVHPSTRSRGIGRQLVSRSIQTGRDHNAVIQRALIAIGNIASERCFAANGFTAEQQCELWVAAPSAREIVQPAAATHLIRVETLTYRGIWVEGNMDAAALKAAQERAHAEGLNTVGMVIPTYVHNEAQSLGFTHIDSYQWWVLEH